MSVDNSNVGDWLSKNDFSVGTWERTVESGEESWNPSYYKLYGIEAINKRPSFDSWLSMVHPDDRERLLRHHDEIRFTRACEVKNDFRILHPEGIRWIQEIGRNFYDSTGALVRMAGIALDISEQKSRELKYQEAERRRIEVLAMLGHEFRQPISVISTAVKLWKRAPQRLPRQLDDIIHEQIQRLDYLVSGLLTSVKSDQGPIDVKLSAINPSEHLEHSVQRAQLQFVKKNHSIKLECRPSVTLIVADPKWFDHVSDNLISNACKYTDQEGEILVRASIENGMLTVSVSDNGVGLKQEALADVFEMYHQEETSAHLSGGGLGIGLALVKQIVQAHGGYVTAQSEGLGCGSTFSARFPVLGPSTSKES